MSSAGLSADDIAKLKVADLKTELASRNLSTKGLKKELADRLIEAISGNAETASIADPAAQSSGDAPSTADEALKQTDNLPSELPAVPPATEDPTDADTLGKDATLTEEAASVPPVEVSAEPSEVVKPAVDSVDKTPGVVSDSREIHAPADQEDKQAYVNGSGEKRKREDELEKVNDDTAVLSVAVQAETAAEDNDAIKQDPAVDDAPQIKRAKVEGDEKTGTDSEGNSKLSADGDRPTKLESRSATADTPSKLSNETQKTAAPAENDPEPESTQSTASTSATRSVSIRGTGNKAGQPESQSVPHSSAADANRRSVEPQSETDGPPASTSLCVSNLVRPFTLPALKEKLEDYGTYSYFWINTVKSHCYVTYDTLDASRKAKQAMTGEVWPETTGKALDLTYLPDARVITLVQQEETSGRARLELVTSFDSESNQWKFDLRPPTSMPPGHRGLASQPPPKVPTAAQADSYRGQTFSNPLLSGQGMRNGAPERVYNDRQRDAGIWQPSRGGDGFLTTKTQPSLYYREADKLAVERRTRELERDRRAPPPRAGFNTYRPNYR